mmetsp:Transcript_13780/g.22957  ORF Transcript_13780/g.22957 Transcript_13780/m.22957 type:complete len:305 (+) Transcript_13780:48-962(+)
MEIDSGSTIGIIGAGMMGTSLAKCLVTNGCTVYAWNRSEGRKSFVEEAGATFVPKIIDIFKQCDIVIMTVVGDTDMVTASSLIKQAGDSGVLKGKTIIQFSSHHPLSAKTQCKLVGDYEGLWIGGAILGSIQQVGDPSCMFFLSGAKESTYSSVEHIIAKLGTPMYFGEDPGLGSLYDMSCMFQVLWGYMGYLLALATVQASGGDIDTYVELSSQVYPPMMADLVPGGKNNVKAKAYDDPTMMQMPVMSCLSTMQMGIDGIEVDAGLIKSTVAQYEALLASKNEAAWSDMTIWSDFVNKKLRDS